MGVRRLLSATSTATIKQRLPTPGYERPFGIRRSTACACSPDCLLVAGRSDDAAELRQRLPAEFPYNADLPYDIKQKALFGEASYKFGQFKLTAGGR